MSVTLFGLVYWALISIATFIFSGNIYYKLENYWIILVPVAVFLFFYVLLKNISPKPKPIIALSIGDNVDLTKAGRALNATTAAVVLATALLAHNLLSTIGVSIFQADELRAQFWGNTELLGSLAGGYIIPILWATNGLLLALLLHSILIDMATGSVLSIRSIILLVAGGLISTSTGGRLQFVLMSALCIFALYACSRKIRGGRLKKRATRAMVFVMTVGVAFLAFQHINRYHGEVKYIGSDSISVNFIGPVFAFDQFIIHDTIGSIRGAAERIGSSAIGVDTLLITGFARGVFHSDIDSMLSLTSSILHQGVSISNTQHTNAFYTAGFGAYVDFGFPGYLMAFLFIGLLAFVSDMIFSKRDDLIPIAFVSVMYHVVFLSVRLSPLDDVSWIIFAIFFTAYHKHFKRSDRHSQYSPISNG